MGMETGKIKDRVKASVWEFRWVPVRYLRVRRSGNPRRVILYLSLVLVIMLFAGLFAVLLAQDVVVSKRVFAGVTIDGRKVGGMSRSEALSVADKAVAAPLAQPLVLAGGGREFKLDLEDIDFKVDAKKMADNAYWVGHDQFILSRMFRRLFGQPLRANIPVYYHYDLKKLKSIINGVSNELDRAPQSAHIDVSGGSPDIVVEKAGSAVVRDATLDAVVAALPTIRRRVEVPVRSIDASLTQADIGRIVLIKLGEHRLYLFNREDEENSYLIATGMPQYPTPTGRFHIYYKEKNPTWLPTSEWAKDQRGIPVPPGPNNPLGGYWMDLGGGIGIHATPFPSTLGQSASHGCIRMSDEGAAELFGLVKVGTPVFITP